MYLSPVYTAAPAVADERVGTVFAALDSLGIPYIRFEHDATATMEDCAAVGKALKGTICKNLFLCNRQQTAFYLLTMPGDKPFHTKDLSAQIGSSRLSFAPPEKMEELLNTHPGSASVMGLLFDTERRVQLVMDRDVYDAEYFCCHPCDNHGSLKIKTSDLLYKISSPRRSRAHRRGPAEGISKQKTSADGRRFFCYVMSPSVKRRTGASVSSVCVQTQAT
ncbi:MAG: prolyl-tRNA synthetase associated domain-containing protein [Oscillospiraceae bacterium]